MATSLTEAGNGCIQHLQGLFQGWIVRARSSLFPVIPRKMMGGLMGYSTRYAESGLIHGLSADTLSANHSKTEIITACAGLAPGLVWVFFCVIKTREGAACRLTCRLAA
jgi:hypothetical protein